MKTAQIEELSANGQFAGVEPDGYEKRQEPFDPEKISIDTKTLSLETIIRRLLQGSIRLAPAFQRNEVWDRERKSQLIESMMLKIPLPMFYVAADEKGNWDVVDGLQRLTTIKGFVLGDKFMETRDAKNRGSGMRLTSLEFWGDVYNGNSFNDLPELLVNRIMETQFQFTIINPGTPEEVKRNIFKRINTGGMPLTPQEIRHALYQGNATTLLKELASSESFIIATDNSVNDSRMVARELVLRFLAFSIRSYTDYPKSSDMDAFLSDTMRIINLMPHIKQSDLAKIFKDDIVPNIIISDTDRLKHRFDLAMKRCHLLFAQHAFRKSFGTKKKAPINKTLFEVWGNVVVNLSETEFNSLIDRKQQLLDAYLLRTQDQYFINSISRDSWKHTGVQDRYAIFSEMIMQTLRM